MFRFFHVMDSKCSQKFGFRARNISLGVFSSLLQFRCYVTGVCVCNVVLKPIRQYVYYTFLLLVAVAVFFYSGYLCIIAIAHRERMAAQLVKAYSNLSPNTNNNQQIMYLQFGFCLTWFISEQYNFTCESLQCCAVVLAYDMWLILCSFLPLQEKEHK